MGKEAVNPVFVERSARGKLPVILSASAVLSTSSRLLSAPRRSASKHKSPPTQRPNLRYALTTSICSYFSANATRHIRNNCRPAPRKKYPRSRVVLKHSTGSVAALRPGVFKLSLGRSALLGVPVLQPGRPSRRLGGTRSKTRRRASSW